MASIVSLFNLGNINKHDIRQMSNINDVTVV